MPTKWMLEGAIGFFRHLEQRDGSCDVDILIEMEYASSNILEKVKVGYPIVCDIPLKHKDGSVDREKRVLL